MMVTSTFDRHGHHGKFSKAKENSTLYSTGLSLRGGDREGEMGGYITDDYKAHGGETWELSR